MMNVCLLQRKEISLQTSKRRRSQNLFYVVCTSVNRQTRGQRWRMFSTSYLYMKKEKAKKDVLGEGLPIYDCIDLPVSLFRHNNLKSYPNIFSPNREINSCLRSVGEIATCKSMIPYASNTVRNNNTTQRFATTKCITLNACNTIGDNEATQRRAMPKCIFPNAGNTIRNNNAIQKE